MSIRNLLVVVVWLMAASVQGAQVCFDLPSSIECRETTPESFAQAHPMLKVIEAKFRISARLLDGNADEIVDFVYVLSSPDKMMRFQDYLPNTTLESAVADDQIEITDSSENGKTTGAEAHVAYKIFEIGATHNQSTKKTECSHYKQIAAKELVLASGTIDREHGVFFRLRPSRAASLEGAKEFTCLVTVPKTWRGDLCTISCTARSKKTTFLSTSVVPSGVERLPIGMYLAGDAEAAALAERLRLAQDSRQALQTAHAAKENVFDTISSQTVGLFTGKKSETPRRKEWDEAERTVLAVQKQLANLAR
ncbi:MAG TPA: hypothetical protein VHV08_02100 [Pirellulales bacterium]|nr:hypothetical protein [Pirellulales bacterium]